MLQHTNRNATVVYAAALLGSLGRYQVSSPVTRRFLITTRGSRSIVRWDRAEAID